MLREGWTVRPPGRRDWGGRVAQLTGSWGRGATSKTS